MNEFKNIQKLAKMLDGHQMVTVEEFRSAVSDFINAFTQHRSAFGEISKKNEESMSKALQNLQKEFDAIRSDVKVKTDEVGMTKEEMKSMMSKCMSDMKDMCDEMESRLPQNGEDGMDADEERIIQEVLAKIKLPEQKEVILDTPDEVVDKVNSSNKKINKERVEGLEQAILNSASNAVNALPVTTTLVNGKRAKNISFSGATVNVVGDTANVTVTSGGSGDVVGPASATSDVPALFDGTTGKLIKNSTPTGTGNPVMQTSPTLISPNIGEATGTSLNTSSSIAAGAGGNGQVNLAAGNGSGSGYVQFYSAGAVRQGYIGFSTTTASSDTGTIPYVAGTHAFTGVINATSPVFVTPALGTPSSGVVTNLTGTASININGTVGATTPTTATFTTATINTGITLAENASIALDPAGSADGKYTGLTVTGIGGATIAFGDLVTLDKDDSRWELVDISVAAAATGDARGLIGIAVTSSTDGGALTVLLQGIIRADANFPALTIGAPVYASTTGDVVVTQPVTTDHIIRVVGFGLTADEMYFNPSNDYITHT